jgi:uncharacterized protein (TIGR03000 family)
LVYNDFGFVQIDTRQSIHFEMELATNSMRSSVADESSFRGRRIMRATFLNLGLAATLVLAMNSPAFAQRGGHGGGFHGGAVHAGGYHGYYGGHPYYHYGYGGGAYFGGGIYLGLGGGPYYYGPPAYYYSDPAYYLGGAPAYATLPPAAYAPAAPAAGPQPVMLSVLVPKADAQVFLGDNATTTTGTERQFQSPPLEAGRSYQYTVRVRWMENGKMVEQKRDVPVRAGQEVTIDFRSPPRESIGLPEAK